MLVLCSNGLSSDRLLSAVAGKTNSAKSAALVVTADHIYKENNYHVRRCMHELERLGTTVSIIDIDHQRSERLKDYDVVEFIGGNPFYLLKSIRDHRAETVLQDLANNRVLIGWSAAAFVFGPTLELVNMYSPEMNYFGLADLGALGLTDIEVLPHYRQFQTRFEKFEEKCSEYEKRHQVSVIRLNDGDGVLITEKQIEICRR